MKFKNRVVVITGAGSGIGRSCALEFAKEGADLVIADINNEGLAETTERLKVYPVKAMPFQVDVSDSGAVQRFAEDAIRNFGSIYTLVNNAAIQINKIIEETTYEEWNKQVAINLGGVFLCSRYFLPHLRISRGSIVNMSSVNAFFVEPACAGYCATKAAIIAFTKALAIDHGREGIRVNCICPGYIDAGLAAGYFESQPDPIFARSEAGKLHALSRIGMPEEVARAAVFLASEDASFVTGTSLVVDGGFGSGIPPR